MQYNNFVDSLRVNVVMNRKLASENIKIKLFVVKIMCCENQ